MFRRETPEDVACADKQDGLNRALRLHHRILAHTVGGSTVNRMNAYNTAPCRKLHIHDRSLKNSMKQPNSCRRDCCAKWGKRSASLVSLRQATRSWSVSQAGKIVMACSTSCSFCSVAPRSAST